MTHSMTAYARKSTEDAFGTVICELRSVNHRYLDLTVRLPEAFSMLEMPFRDAIRQRVSRGKVECHLRFEAAKSDAGEAVVNLAFADTLIRAAQQIIDRLPAPAPVNPTDILRWPGVLQTGEGHRLESIAPALSDLLSAVLTEFISARAREGEDIKKILFQRLDAMTACLARLRERLPQLEQMQRQRLLARFSEAKTTLDPVRLEQEMVLYAQKIDVSEEIERLDAHITEVRRVLMHDKVAGRRLDFLMQEMNREANTLGSKSVDLDTTRASVELKVLIEQMREQVQNIE